MLLSLFNMCWSERKVPSQWHASRVSAIFKKGAPEQCDNYRPISLVCVAYKIHATVLLRRLQAAGAESRLTATQYGFRRGYGTGDAIFCVRRLVELAAAQRFGRISMLALDWKKAFDSINPKILVLALRRFGVPGRMLDALGDIYSSRIFRVADGSNGVSSEHKQMAGISQGCPLSPFLFVMVMSVIMADAERELSMAAQQTVRSDQLLALLYADDTLLVSTHQEHLQ